MTTFAPSTTTSDDQSLGAFAVLRDQLHDMNTPDDGWRKPDPLRAHKRTPFPLDALPPVLRNMATELAEALQVDPVMVALPALCVAATACGPAQIQVNGAWYEPSPLWGLIAADPGSRKSAALKAAMAPLLAAETSLQERDAKTRPAKNVKIAVAETALKAAQKAMAAGPEGTDDPTPEDFAALEDAVNTAAANLRAVRAEVGVAPRLNVGGYATSEKLHDLLADHKAMLMAVPEAETLLRKLGVGDLDRDIFLQAWSMETHERSLVTREVPAAENPCLNLFCNVQVDALLDIVKQSRDLMTTGLFDRFLPAAPFTGQLQTAEFIDLSDPTALDAVVERSPGVQAYHSAIKCEVLRTAPLRGEPTHWVLAKGVAQVQDANYAEWAGIKHLYAADAETALGKLSGQVLRLARVLAQLEMVVPPGAKPSLFGGTFTPLETDKRYPIQREHLIGAWKLAWYFHGEHSYLFGDAAGAEQDAERMARAVLRKCRQFAEADIPKDSVSARDLRRKGLGRWESKELTRVLDALAQAGWVRATTASRYELHPDLAHYADQYGI